METRFSSIPRKKLRFKLTLILADPWSCESTVFLWSNYSHTCQNEPGIDNWWSEDPFPCLWHHPQALWGLAEIGRAWRVELWTTMLNPQKQTKVCVKLKSKHVSQWLQNLGKDASEDVLLYEQLMRYQQARGSENTQLGSHCIPKKGEVRAVSLLSESWGRGLYTSCTHTTVTDKPRELFYWSNKPHWLRGQQHDGVTCWFPPPWKKQPLWPLGDLMVQYGIVQYTSPWSRLCLHC